MPFLLNTKNSFIIVDNKPRQGLFYQFYNSTGFSRPLQIQSYISNAYCATLDTQDNLHVVTQNPKNQIMHYTYQESSSHHSLLLDDPKNIYKFSNLLLHHVDTNLHFFYTAFKPNVGTYSLVHQNLSQNVSSIEHVLPSFVPLLPLKSIALVNEVHIFFVISDTSGYSINCFIYSPEGSRSVTLCTSEFPIIDFDVCLISGIYHLTYTRDIYGTYQLLYYNTSQTNPTILKSSTQLSSPCLLCYLGHLWITYLDNHTLYMMLSTNMGQSFSLPVKSSLQDNLYQYTYCSTKPCSLIATTLYALVFNKIRLAVVSSIDVDEIHPDLPVNTELDLLLEGLSFTPKSAPVSVLNASSTSLKQNASYQATPVELPSDEKQKTKSILSAAQAFMNEMNTFDAQPIYLKSENSTL